MNPVQGPVRDGVHATHLDIARHGHGQDAVVARRVAQRHIVPRQAPILVGGQVHHLVHHAIAYPGPLLAGGAVDKGIVRVQLHRAHTGRKDAVDLCVAAGETGLSCPGVEQFPQADARQPHRADRAMDEHDHVA